MPSLLQMQRIGKRCSSFYFNNRNSARRWFSLSDMASSMAAQALVDKALDTMASESARKASALDLVDAEDASTWRLIVDRPVVADADNITSADLYPSRAPQLSNLGPLSLSALQAGREYGLTAVSQDDSKPSTASSTFSFFTNSSSSSNSNQRQLEKRHQHYEQQQSLSMDESIRNDESWDHVDYGKFPKEVESIDPFELVGPELLNINHNIKQILGIDHPVLSTVAKYFFDFGGGGKKIRPALVLLMAHAVNAHESSIAGVPYSTTGEFGQNEKEAARKFMSSARAVGGSGVMHTLPAHLALPLQRRLAEITEMIHTASLLHDDVIDAADTRRGVSSVNTLFGNKLAVLAGDFLLARASICLARLRSVPVIELLSTVIEHLVKGEVMQMKSALRSDAATKAAFDLYLRKTYYKTGSLMANSCQAIALLGGYAEETRVAAYKYGMHLGIAFQLVDDMLDFEGTSLSLGKPALSDVRQGLATAPVLFAAHRFPLLLSMIERKFATPGDLEYTVRTVQASDGILLTRRLAIAHINMALEAIAPLADSPARTALASLCRVVLTRKK